MIKAFHFYQPWSIRKVTLVKAVVTDLGVKIIQENVKTFSDRKRLLFAAGDGEGK